MLLFYINSILMFYPKICFRKQVLFNSAYKRKLIINLQPVYTKSPLFSK